MAFDLLLKAGCTSQIVEVTIRDATTGQGKTGIAANSVAFLYQKRGNAASTATSACSAMSAGTWVSGGWCAVDASNAPGLYQFGVPNAALAGTDAVTIRFKISGAIDKEVKIVLTAVDLQDAVAAGISRLDATVGSRSSLTLGDIWQSAVGGYNSVAGSFGKLLSDNLDAAISSRSTLTAANVWDLAVTGHTTAGTFGEALNTAYFNATVFNTLVESSGGNRFKAKALETAPTGGGLTAADVWAYATRTLTFDQTFLDSIAISVWNAHPTDYEWQAGSYGEELKNAFDSGFSLASGQTVDANVVTWRGTQPAPLVDLGVSGQCVPSYTMQMAGTALGQIALNVWGDQMADFTTAGTFGNALRTGVTANVTQWNGSPVTQWNDGGTAYPSINVRGWLSFLCSGIVNGMPNVSLGSAPQDSLVDAIWNEATSGHTAAGSYGKLITDNLDAKVSTVGGGSLTAADIWSHATRSLTDKAGFMLSATQSFDNAGQTTRLPASVEAWRGQLVSNPVLVGSGVGPLVSVYGLSAEGSDATRNAVWNAATASHTTAGSFGKLVGDNLDAKVSTRATGSDVAVNVWGANVGAYNGSPNTFGKLVYDNLDAQVGSRMASGATVNANLVSTSVAGKTAIIDAVWNGIITDWDDAPGSFGQWVSRMNGMIEADGGVYRFTGNSLETAPAGGTLAADVSAIKSQTDKLYFTNHGDGTFNVRTNVIHWNSVLVSTNGGFPQVHAASMNNSAAMTMWNQATTTLTTVGSIGKLLVDNVDSKISTAGGGSLTAAEVWAHASRSLTAAVDANVTQWRGVDVTYSLNGAFAYPTVDVRNWNGGNVSTSGGYPVVHTTAMSTVAASAVWSFATADAIVPGSFGKLLADNIDAKISTIGGSLTAADIWSHATRSLTDKAGFSLAATQGFDNTGQTTNLPVNVVQWAGYNQFVTGDARRLPKVSVDGDDMVAIRDSVWSKSTGGMPAAGTIGRLVLDNLSGLAGTALGDVKAKTDQLVFVSGDVRATLDGEVVNAGVDTAGIATAVWSAGTRSLTDKAGFALADGSIAASTFAAGAIDATVAPNLDAAVSSRMATFAYVAPDNAGIAAIKSQTDQIVFTPHGDGTFDVRANAINNVAVDNAAIATAVWSAGTRSLTDKIGFGLANGAISTSTFTAGAIDATVAPSLDAPVSSRMASFTYVPPDNAGIAAIQAKTDQLSFIGGDLVATLDGETVSAGVTNASIAAAVWANATRTITGGSLDSVMDVLNPVATSQAAAIASIKAATDKITFVARGDGTWDVRVPVVPALSAADVWGYGARTLTDKSGFALANGSVTSATFGPGAINSIVAPNLDVAVSSRMASFAYVAPDNAGIAAIRTQTDKLRFTPHGDGTYDVQSNAVATIDAGAIASAVWVNGVRTLTMPVADWTDLERGQIRKALGLSGTTAQTSGEGLLDDVHHVSMKLQFNSESDVLASLAGETVFLNPMQNFNNIGQADELPAKDAILRQLLTPARADRLDHLDVSVSSRSSHSPTDVWSFSDRTLTSFGTLVADMAAAVWSYGTRTLTSFGSLVADIWGTAVRTVTGGAVDLSTQAKADVRSAADAALTDFDPLTYSDAAFDRDQIIDQVEAVLAAVNVKPDASAIASAVDALLSTNHGEGSWIDTTKGSGPIAYTVTVTDGTNPVAFASVRLSVGPLGISQTTDAQGKAVFDVQPGTYKVQIAKLGYTGHSTTVEIHSEPADQAFPGIITPLAVISLPPEPGQCIAYLTTYDAVGNVQSGVDIEVRLVSPPAGSIAESFSAKPWTVTSDAQGLVQVTLLKNAAYQARRGSGEWHLLKTDNRDSVPMPTVLSHPSK